MKIFYPDAAEERETARLHNPDDPALFMSDEHCHGQYELFFWPEGHMRYQIDGAEYPIAPGQVVLIPPYCLHRTFYEGKGGERIVILLGEGFLDTYADPELRKSARALFETPVLSLEKWRFERLYMELKDKTLPLLEKSPLNCLDRTRVSLLLGELILLLVSEGVNVYAKKNDAPVRQPVQAVAEYLNAHYKSPIMLDELCRRFYISKHYLCHRFRQTYGVSIVQFQHQNQLSHAEQLLLFTARSIREIAEETGFQNVNYFNRLFRKKHGITPGQYRKSNGK